MSLRRRIEALERAMPEDWPRCECGAILGGSPPFLFVDEHDRPTLPTCPKCGCPLCPDGRAVPTVPPGCNVKVMVL